ncbi:polymerase [Porton virus]|nr:polymerase [Porton virus]UAX43315.1 polymerase [Porton virus]
MDYDENLFNVQDDIFSHYENEDMPENDFLEQDALLYFDEEVDPMEFLNQFDYNLNSPVIVDHIQELEKFLNGSTYNQVFEKREWWIWKKLLTLEDHISDGPDIKKSLSMLVNNTDLSKYHKSLFNKVLSTKIYNDTPFIQIFEKSINHAKDTSIILRTFLRGWCSKEFDHTILTSLDIEKVKNAHWFLKFQHWGEMFWDLYKIILFMNATGLREMQNLKRIFGGQMLISKGELIGYKLYSQVFGTVFIIGSYMWSKNDKMFFDRNLILMIKDLLISRSQTIISMEYRIDDPFQQIDITNLIDLYDLGDQMVQTHGNKAYDGLKLIEPICNLKLCQLAREYRPLIPKFPEFEAHVNNSVIEKSCGTNHLIEIQKIIEKSTELKVVLTYYSIFRHWGHPTIEYFEGLEKLHSQVTMEKTIDDKYAQSLASDFAYKILRKNFFEKKQWFVDKANIPLTCKLRNHILNNTWPNQYQIEDFGDNWHTLPITKIYDLPDLVDPSIIYSDKSHSMNRSEVLNHIREFPNKPIPTKRVLKTLLERPETNWKQFLQEVNDYGLDMEDLIIGLKAKEREMKRIGRFFSLMSWKLREYFVYTEYLIKEYFVPLFKGLTMADDLQSVIKKMLENSNGQGLNDYSQVSIANHIDYEKWNNHQRKESNCHVFKVMGQCFGLPNLFSRTHEFFEKSLIYYNQRPDLMIVSGDEIFCPEKLVAWNGQAGGLEGLRQKGWSILNLLVIERESKIRNTLVKILAQGDNQTISTFYTIQNHQIEEELTHQLSNIVKNNNAVMSAIERGTNSLGLLINKDETMVSADYLNYGKVPIFRGIIRGLDAKRWSRVNFGNNDQLPSTGGLLASVTTNSLTVAHFSQNPLNAMHLHNLFANVTLSILEIYNPALRDSPMEIFKQKDCLLTKFFRITAIYLDPSLGGIGGTSLTRYLIRMFPDPVTESLSFWKLIYQTTNDSDLKCLCLKIGNPQLEEFEPKHLDKLIEDPVGLNIKRGISATNLLKNEVKKNLLQNSNQYQNAIIRHALEYITNEEESLFAWVRSIKPLFPRFISEFVNATYYGITTSIVGLFQNSRTIRNQFRKKYTKRIDDVVFKSEIIGITSLIKICNSVKDIEDNIWVCSSGLADQLREKSWGAKVLGTTVPHPIEMLGGPWNLHNLCRYCELPNQSENYLTLMIPKGLSQSEYTKGPYPPYLGSKTSETTSLIQPWEKETNIPLIKRATRLRNAICWFINPDGFLARGILDNLEKLTGEVWGSKIKGFKRTGSALHRFSCARQSNGGFSASAPTDLTWMICTTDTMEGLNDKNYDFMFQSLIVYAQATGSLTWHKNSDPVNIHYHIQCGHCLRPIEEPILEAEWELNLPNVSHIISSWRPDPNVKWSTEKTPIDIPPGNWESLNDREKTFNIGHAVGFVFTDMLMSHSNHVSDSSLFPLGIRNKLHPKSFFHGLFLGIQRACALQLIHRRNLIEMQKPKIAQWGASYYVIEELSKVNSFLSFVRDGPLNQEICSIPHKIPSSYPLTNTDMGSLTRTYLKRLLTDWFDGTLQVDLNHRPWIFSDLQSHDLIGSMSSSRYALRLIMNKQPSKQFRETVKKIQELYINIKNENWTVIDITMLTKQLILCESEIRHAVKSIIKIQDMSIRQNWEKECIGKVSVTQVPYDSIQRDCPKLDVPRRAYPGISGLRILQLATGAHYKVRSIIEHHKIKWTGGLVGGDGSGGITALLCRMNPHGRVIFNSLLIMDGIDLKGSHPGPPSAVKSLGPIGNNCVNRDTVWKHPNDLSDFKTWQYFHQEKQRNKMTINLMIFDMEVTSEDVISKIEYNLSTIGLSLLDQHGVIIFKTYIGRLLNEYSIIDRLGSQFKNVSLNQTEFSSSYTSEVYVVFNDLTCGPIQHKFPDKMEIWQKAEQFYCFRNHKEELDRARKIYFMDTLMGVPPEILPSITIDWGTQLVALGMDTGYAVSLSKSWERYHKSGDGFAYLLGSVGLFSERMIPTFRISPTEPRIPSNTELINIATLLVGIWIWISIATNNLQLYSLTYEMINSGIKFSFFRNYIPRKGWRITWKINEGKSDGLDKMITIRHKLGGIGQIIRSAHRMYRVSGGVLNKKKIEGFLHYYNKKLSSQHLIKYTSVLDCLKCY